MEHEMLARAAAQCGASHGTAAGMLCQQQQSPRSGHGTQLRLRDNFNPGL